LIQKIAAEQPDAIFINGDLTWHGVSADYEVFREESRLWRQQHLRLYPTLGNHEFAGCSESDCLELWWTAFPELQGRRWYSVALGSRVLAVMLDSDASLLPGSGQRLWLEHQLSAIDPRVRLVLVVLHHPPVADVQTVGLVDHNPRDNEQALANYLGAFAAHTPARVVVSAGHIHNYERFQRDGVLYLVSGGGGAKPYEVARTPADLYQSSDFPNYHYVRFELRGRTLAGAMIRLTEGDANGPTSWEVRDSFELTLPP
jgi:hypothetical protein